MWHNDSSAATILSEKRKALALKFRVAGYTYAEIVEKVREELGDECPKSYDSRYCWRDVNHSLTEYRTEIKETVQDLISLEVERLDKLFSIAMESAEAGSMKGVLTALKVMERRSKLLGIDAPTQVVVRDWRDEILDLIKAGRITIDQVKSELGENMFQALIEYKGLPVPMENANIISGEFSEKQPVPIEAEV